MSEPTFIEQLAQWHDRMSEPFTGQAEFEKAQHIATAEALRKMEAALKPFALCEPSSVGSIPTDKIYLWKPNCTGRDSNGISKFDIDRAKQALQPPTKEQL